MLATLWKNLLPILGGERKRRETADRLSDIMAGEGRLALNQEAASRLGVAPRRVVRAAYDLALAERAQIRADADGQLELLSNIEFDREVFAALFAANPAPINALSSLLQEEEPQEEEPAEAITPEPEKGLDWFQLDVAPPEDDADGREKLPFDRQGLPDRRREPWVILENAVLDEA